MRSYRIHNTNSNQYSFVMVEAEQEWLSFLKDWDKNFSDAKYILSYLKSYPQILDEIHVKDIIGIDQIESSQREWVWLCSQFDNELERDFFKPFWIPLQENSYTVFMDISDKNFPIFEANYFFFKPYRWYKKYIVENISDLLLANDTGLDLHNLSRENDKKRWKIVHEFFAERRKSGLEGKY